MLLIPYKAKDMIYSDYKTSARADHDNPQFITGNDDRELNRTEKYEMLYFISSLGRTWHWSGYPRETYQHLERIIREEVPRDVQTHAGIRDWIAKHYNVL